MIDRNGNVFEGRPVDAVGDTATNYDPSGHFLPMCEGDFNEHDPTEAQLDSLARLIGWARRAFGSDLVSGHRDHASTTCPGDRLAAVLPEVISASEAHLGTDLAFLSAAEGAERVAVIESGG